MISADVFLASILQLLDISDIKSLRLVSKGWTQCVDLGLEYRALYYPIKQRLRHSLVCRMVLYGPLNLSYLGGYGTYGVDTIKGTQPRLVGPYGIPPDTYYWQGIKVKAAKYGHLDVLQWAHANNSNWYNNEWICVRAVEGGHLAVLQWIRVNGCPWDIKVSGYAAYNKDRRAAVGPRQWLSLGLACGCHFNRPLTSCGIDLTVMAQVNKRCARTHCHLDIDPHAPVNWTILNKLFGEDVFGFIGECL
jgi:hypothetical protein